MNFSQYASRFISQSTLSVTTNQDQPLFYSTYDFNIPEDDKDEEGEDLNQNNNRKISRRTRTTEDDRSITSITEDISVPPPSNQLPGSRLWSQGSILPTLNFTRPTISRGWRAHESTAEVYRERYELDEEEYDDEDAEDGSTASLSPPTFLSSRPTPPELPPDGLTTPLLLPQTLYVYPSSSRGVGGRVELRKYRDSNWIAIYGACICALAVIGAKEWWDSAASPTLPAIIPAIPLLSLLSLLSVIATISALAYLLLVQSAVKHLVMGGLIAGPVSLVIMAITAWISSYGQGGIERDQTWKNAIRIFSAICFILAYILLKIAMKSTKRVNRTIKVLELSSSIVLSHPPLFFLCLGVSLVSTILTLPFLSILARLLSDGSYSFSSKTSTFFLLGMWIWTLSILRGIQRVTVAGVVGSWFFNRNELDHPTALEVTTLSFYRSIGPSLGTIILASLIISIFETLAVVARKARDLIRSTKMLSPLMILAPVLTMISQALNVFNGWCLCYSGLTGDDMMGSARKAKDLIIKNGTLGLADNILTKLILNITAFVISLFAGFISFLIISSRVSNDAGNGSYLPLVALLCFAIPFSTIKLCSNILNDACDTLFLAWNVDLSTSTVHSAKANEAFGEPDTPPLA